MSKVYVTNPVPSNIRRTASQLLDEADRAPEPIRSLLYKAVELCDSSLDWLSQRQTERKQREAA